MSRLRRITLLQIFSLVSLLSVILVGLLLGILVTDSIRTSSITSARDHLAEVVRAGVLIRDPQQESQAQQTPAGGVQFAQATPRLLLTPAEFTAPHKDGAEWSDWDHAVVTMFAGLPIYLVKVWNQDSTVVWSDRNELIGERHPEDPELQAALNGQMHAGINSLQKAENAEERTDQPALLEVYVPILERGTFRVVGAFEVYEQVDDLVTQLQIAQENAIRAIVLSMGALYLLLVGLFARASSTIRRLQRLQELERYFSPAVARAIAAGDLQRSTGGNSPARDSRSADLSRRLLSRSEISVLFTDIRGFTRQSEQMDAEDVVQMLNAYMDVVTTAVFNHNGSIDKFLGDGVLAVFGAPLTDPNHALDAVGAALAIRTGLETLNRQRVAAGHVPVIIGTAVTTGLAVTGNIGSDKQLSFTVTGDTVNLGSRLVGVARAGEILITTRTYELMQRDALTGEATGPWHVSGPETISVRGREEPATIYELEPQPAPSVTAPPALPVSA